jgi:hypothetical protein
VKIQIVNRDTNQWQQSKMDRTSGAKAPILVVLIVAAKAATHKALFVDWF